MSIVVSGWQKPKYYTQLEYIESDGTQYIDLPGEAKGKIYQCDIEYTSLYTDDWDWFIGSRVNNVYWLAGYYNRKARFWASGYGYYGAPDYGVGVRGIFEVDFEKYMCCLTVDGVTHSWSIPQITPSYPVRLFIGNGGSTFSKGCKCKCYGVTGTLMNLVPAKYGDDVGLYDRANDVFYASGSGVNFVAGPAIGTIGDIPEPTLVNREVDRIFARGEKTLDRPADLYSAGEQYTTITGGWTQTGHAVNNTFTAAEDELYLSCYGGWAQTNGVQTAKAVDLTGYTKVCIELKIDNALKLDDGLYYTWMHFGLWDSRFDGTYGSPPGGKSLSINGLSENIANKRVTLTVDVDGMTSAYIGLLYRNYGGYDETFPCHIYRVYAIDHTSSGETVPVNREIGSVYRTLDGVVRQVFPEIANGTFVKDGRFVLPMTFMKSYDSTGSASWKYNGNSILLEHNQCGGSMLISDEMFDVSSFNTLTAKLTAFVNNTRKSMFAVVMLFTEKPADLAGKTYYSYYHWYSGILGSSGGAKIIAASCTAIAPDSDGLKPCVLDVSGFSGKYYIAIEVVNSHNGSGSGSISFSDLYLE